ncbi:MAG: radical SAM protein [Cyanobacteria bacterium SIG29]|nr:radical SAM protein [Cyanobacteria bacterium SIG29]
MGKKYFCDELNNVLSCFHDRIMSCCSGQIGPVYYEAYKGEKIDWKAFKQFKKDSFDLLTEENIENSPCKGCFFLRERKETDEVSETFKTINISHWTQCNCGCIYCARMYDSKGEITYKSGKSKYYDMIPLLKQLYKENLLNKNDLTACIQGGDISVLKEFEPMVKEFLKNGITRFNILSNNIVYQPIIKKLLDKNLVDYTTSLDCATPELYKKLKRVDKFKDSVNNLKKYAKSKNKRYITVKYIIVEHINDNKEEITKFVNLMSDIGIENIEFMIDNKYVLFTDLNTTPLPKHYGELYLHFKKSCEEKGIRMTMWQKTEHIIKEYALK